MLDYLIKDLFLTFYSFWTALPPIDQFKFHPKFNIFILLFFTLCFATFFLFLFKHILDEFIFKHLLKKSSYSLDYWTIFIWGICFSSTWELWCIGNLVVWHKIKVWMVEEWINNLIFYQNAFTSFCLLFFLCSYLLKFTPNLYSHIQLEIKANLFFFIFSILKCFTFYSSKLL